MTERDVQKREYAIALSTAVPRDHLWTSLGVRLTSSVLVLIAVPLLVLTMGVVLTLTMVRELHTLGRSEALKAFALRANFAEAQLGNTFAEADSLLDRVQALTLAYHPESNELTPFAVRLRDLALRRPGLKWLSASFPDGTFLGVFVNLDGKVVFESSRMTGATSERAQYDFDGDSIRLTSKTQWSYDPRDRPFYREAVERKSRFWTKPYPFYTDGRTGITRAEPLFRTDGSLHAVITVDYDMAELSDLLRDTDPSVRLVAFTSDGTILARNAPRAHLPASAPQKTLKFADLPEPELRDFFSSRVVPVSSKPRELSTASGRYLAVERPMPSARELDWHLGAVVAEDVLLAAANRNVRATLWSSSSLVALAVALSAMLAVGITRLKSARRKADARADRAVAEARTLGSYRLEEPIRSGGMGQVWRATHRLLTRPAAIKLIRNDLPGVDPAVLEARFEREARILAHLRSPHTVSVFDYGKATDGRLYLVMELLDGLPLDELVKRYGPMPAGRVIPILQGICHSLAEAHAAGLVHRDIKPANVFLCHETGGIERAKLLDFGLAKEPPGSGLTTRGQVSGTMEYMAPEQARGEMTDARADLYSLGCTAFFLLTGRSVFEGSSDVALVIAHQTEQPRSLRSCTKQWIPQELEQLIARCLAKNPEFRPRSAASVGRALAEIVIPDTERFTVGALESWWAGVAAERETRKNAASARVSDSSSAEAARAI